MHICLHNKSLELTHLIILKRPFRGNSNDAISKAIAYEELKYPDNAQDILSAECIDVISKVSSNNVVKLLYHPATRFSRR